MNKITGFLVGLNLLLSAVLSAAKAMDAATIFVLLAVLAVAMDIADNTKMDRK